MPAHKIAATMLCAPQPDAPKVLLPPIARKEAVKKFMAGMDCQKAEHRSEIGSGLSISIVGNNLLPPISPSPAKSNNVQPAEYTIQMMHGMPSPCKIRASPSLSPIISKNQHLARIESKIDGLISGQGIESPPTVSKSHRLANIERTIDGILFSSFGPSSDDPSSPDLQRLHGALLNSRSPDVQLSKSKLRRPPARAVPRDLTPEVPHSLPSRLTRLECKVNSCLERLSASQDGDEGWHWQKFQRLQRIEDRLDQILNTALIGNQRTVLPAQDPILRRNQLLPHVLIAAAAQERRINALNLMKLQGKDEREFQAALAFKADDSGKQRNLPRAFKPARCP